jgi:DNA polymerase (family 10)
MYVTEGGGVVDNRNRAKYIFAVASILEALGANPYRVRAYRRAAVGLQRLPEDAAAYLDASGELALPWLGPRLRKKLGELVRTDRMCFQEELIGTLPAPMRELIAVPGIGPRWAERLATELEIQSVEDLARAAEEHRLQTLRGIGPVREQQLADAAGQLLGRLQPDAASPAGATQAA